MGGEVVQECEDMLFGFFCCLCLFGGDAAERNKRGDVNCLGIVHDGAHNLLDSLYPVWG